MPGTVTHNEAQSRYELEIEGSVAYSSYVREEDKLVIVHTVTPPALRGRGIASRLVKEMLADVRRQGLKIVPRCSFIVDYFERHPEERDVLAD